MKILTRHEQDGLLDFICEQYLVALRSHKNGIMNVNQFGTIQSRAFRMAEIVGGKEGVDTLISRSDVCQDRYHRQENSEPEKTPKKGGRP